MYEVKLLKGGVLKAPHFREDYLFDRVYPYTSKDKKYVEEVLMNEPRLQVDVLEEEVKPSLSKSNKSDDKKSSGKSGADK